MELGKFFVVKRSKSLLIWSLLQAARETKELGASEFCMVLAIKGPDEKTMGRLIELTHLVQDEVGINVAVSAGILTREQAERFAEAGVHRYNHNLETEWVGLLVFFEFGVVLFFIVIIVF